MILAEEEKSESAGFFKRYLLVGLVGLEDRDLVNSMGSTGECRH